MDTARLIRRDEFTWEIPPTGKMRVPAILYADGALIRDMDDKVYEQASNVAMLPGIVKAAYAMPDAHWGYGFPIGGVAAFDPAEVESFPPAAWASIFPAGCAPCTPASGGRRSRPSSTSWPRVFTPAFPAGSAAPVPFA
jgi:hypothetical protein